MNRPLKGRPDPDLSPALKALAQVTFATNELSIAAALTIFATRSGKFY
jgi:hypothetical protein